MSRTIPMIFVLAAAMAALARSCWLTRAPRPESRRQTRRS